MTCIAVLGIGYFLGAIPFGVLVGKLWKKDIRQYGSGNVGFTNAWRVLGIGPASLVLIGDFSKGFLAAYIGSLLQNETGALLGGMIAIIGHTLSCFDLRDQIYVRWFHYSGYLCTDFALVI